MICISLCEHSNWNQSALLYLFLSDFIRNLPSSCDLKLERAHVMLCMSDYRAALLVGLVYLHPSRPPETCKQGTGVTLPFPVIILASGSTRAGRGLVDCRNLQRTARTGRRISLERGWLNLLPRQPAAMTLRARAKTRERETYRNQNTAGGQNASNRRSD